MNYLCAVDVYH